MGEFVQWFRKEWFHVLLMAAFAFFGYFCITGWIKIAHKQYRTKYAGGSYIAALIAVLFSALVFTENNRPPLPFGFGCAALIGLCLLLYVYARRRIAARAS